MKTLYKKLFRTVLLIPLFFCFLSVGYSSAQEATPTPTVIYQAVPINYLNSAALIFLAIVCIALTIKPQVPILNFIFGIIVLGISAATAGQTDMLLFGYLPILTIILAIVCMLSGYSNWKH